MKKIKLISAIFTAFSASFLFGFLCGFDPVFIQFAAFVSGIFTIWKYFKEQDDNKILKTLDQISFFREKILTENNKFVNFVRETEPKYYFELIPLDEPSLEAVRENYLEKEKKQRQLLREKNTVLKQIAVLDMLEEFSSKVIFLGTFEHNALKCVKAAFIFNVELHAIVLLDQRYTWTGNSIYSSTLELYSLWKDSVDRTTPEERMLNLDLGLS